MPEQRLIATAGIISVGVGTVNSIGKNGTPPSTRFLLGSGVLFFILSAMSEAEPELAKALALAVMTTVILGDGGGVLSYLNHKGEIDTQAPSRSGGKSDATKNTTTHTTDHPAPGVHHVSYPGLAPAASPANV